MMTILVYDISDDRARTRVADVCLDYGLDRIQLSAFGGQLSRNHQEALMLRIGKKLGKKAGRVQMFTICAQDWARRIEIVNEAEES